MPRQGYESSASRWRRTGGATSRRGRAQTCGRRPGPRATGRAEAARPGARPTPRGLIGSASLHTRSVGACIVRSLAERSGRSLRIHGAASGNSCAYSGRQSSGSNGVMSIPADVAVRTMRRTRSGWASATVIATTPPIDCATRSTGPSAARPRTSRARSSMLLTSGRGGTRPSPGQSKSVLSHAAGRRSATGRQKRPSPEARAGRKRGGTRSPGCHVERAIAAPEEAGAQYPATYGRARAVRSIASPASSSTPIEFQPPLTSW